MRFNYDFLLIIYDCSFNGHKGLYLPSSNDSQLTKRQSIA